MSERDSAPWDAWRNAEARFHSNSAARASSRNGSPSRKIKNGSDTGKKNMFFLIEVLTC